MRELVLTPKFRRKRPVPLGLILPEVPLSKVFSGKNLREGERLRLVVLFVNL